MNFEIEGAASKIEKRQPRQEVMLERGTVSCYDVIPIQKQLQLLLPPPFANCQLGLLCSALLSKVRGNEGPLTSTWEGKACTPLLLLCMQRVLRQAQAQATQNQQQVGHQNGKARCHRSMIVCVSDLTAEMKKQGRCDKEHLLLLGNGI